MSYYLSYDSDGNRVEKTSVNGQTKTITSGTDNEGNFFVSNDGVTAKTVTDDFGRIKEVKTSREKGISVYNTTYEYASGSAQNSTTNLVKSLTQKFGNTQLLKYEYKYDSNGNITRIEEGGEVVAMYWYDELNQLVSSSERDSGLYTVYSYDKAGNITNVKEYELDLVKWYPLSLIRERTYKYTDSSWKDKLTSYNGTNITYDKIGNPLTYRDGMTMTWENGRQLSTLKTGENEVSYKYDSNGLRTQKEDDNGTTYYYYDSNKNLIGLTKGYKTLYFYYDSEGSPTSFSYNGEMYYYVKNLQGDIVKVINKTGVLYARYEYDAFGKILYAYGDPIISALSPFRYRGYVYDTETGLYYLQSRYYDPVTGRFLNADIYCDTQTGTPLSTNMFTYCSNNPIFKYDNNGYWEKSNHATMCKMAGFSKTTQNWVKYADSYFSSGNDKINKKTKYCSAPFHSRTSALKIAKYIYNKAVKVKKSKNKVKFYNSGNSKNKNKTGCLYKEYFGYRLTKDPKQPLTMDNNRAKDLPKRLNNLKSSKEQSEALLGLALHTLQDYFAHRTNVDVYLRYDGDIYYRETMLTTEFSHYYAFSTKDFEDNKNQIPWRYKNSQRVTYVVYDFYKKNKTINNISVKYSNGNKKSYRFFCYSTGCEYQLYSREYYLTIS